ncbi:uncharacterized protein LOC144337603 [Macaca mulatta]
MVRSRRTKPEIQPAPTAEPSREPEAAGGGVRSSAWPALSFFPPRCWRYTSARQSRHFTHTAGMDLQPSQAGCEHGPRVRAMSTSPTENKPGSTTSKNRTKPPLSPDTQPKRGLRRSQGLIKATAFHALRILFIKDNEPSLPPPGLISSQTLRKPTIRPLNAFKCPCGKFKAGPRWVRPCSWLQPPYCAVSHLSKNLYKRHCPRPSHSAGPGNPLHLLRAEPHLYQTSHGPRRQPHCPRARQASEQRVRRPSPSQRRLQSPRETPVSSNRAKPFSAPTSEATASNRAKPFSAPTSEATASPLRTKCLRTAVVASGENFLEGLLSGSTAAPAPTLQPAPPVCQARVGVNRLRKEWGGPKPLSVRVHRAGHLASARVRPQGVCRHGASTGAGRPARCPAKVRAPAGQSLLLAPDRPQEQFFLDPLLVCRSLGAALTETGRERTQVRSRQGTPRRAVRPCTVSLPRTQAKAPRRTDSGPRVPSDLIRPSVSRKQTPLTSTERRAWRLLPSPPSSLLISPVPVL